MKLPIFLTVLTAFVTLSACEFAPRTVDAPQRTMGVTAGPELVFDRPVQEVLPQLGGARATGQNGRVGNELVFWGYRLEDGNDAWFFACAPLEGINCTARSTQICPAGNTRVVTQIREQGLVRELNCQVVGQAGIGDRGSAARL